MPRAVSVVIPLLNEASSLVELHRELNAIAEASDYALQTIFVDDGSTDASWEVIQSLAAQDPTVEAIRLRRNFGKAAALDAGFCAACAPIVVTMDADGQDDPAEVPRLLAKIDEGNDVVSGWKIDRKDPWHKRWPSLVFNALVSWLTGVRLHDHNCGLKAYRLEAVEQLRLYGELHRFIPVLAAAQGFRIGEVAVHHRAREFGKSKYGATRLIKGLLDLMTVKFLTGYGDRPQHALGSVGLLAFGAGCLGLFYLACRWVISRVAPGFEPIHLHETAAIFYALTLCLVGAQFLAVALLGAMVAASRERPSYVVAQHTLGEAARRREAS
ncbi:glycosyltransferase family 2 protein [Botrimarina hoheduenensis]|uniref:Undecaprenyl-phosphate 4-deoxy-4-formamido-L-arabinose transferase n=1 Tax=Botrimarina hoheduenensis TaxID=2528000 RepID=A0A5C5VVT3_9BACT|nr:glycosyltransferase family 2 protein [Botrimarina hoheduenensis]TWT42708.1 Undecaprenyl-phosphate 4-deoxy-4-formamido-L-arabinose transferase [Botrimarina hoheduenensis]